MWKYVKIGGRGVGELKTSKTYADEIFQYGTPPKIEYLFSKATEYLPELNGEDVCPIGCKAGPVQSKLEQLHALRLLELKRRMRNKNDVDCSNKPIIPRNEFL